MTDETSAPTNETHQGTHRHGVGHVVPLRVLIGTGFALLVLTVVTVAVAKVDLGEMNIWIALAIAVLKGSLVALFFMHLRWDRPFNAIIIVGSLAFVALFISLAMTDSAEYKPNLEKGDAIDVRTKLAEQNP